MVFKIQTNEQYEQACNAALSILLTKEEDDNRKNHLRAKYDYLQILIKDYESNKLEEALFLLSSISASNGKEE